MAQIDSFDRSQAVDIGSPEKLAQWSKRLNVPEEALKAAVLAVGPRLDRVLDQLGAKSAGSEQAG